MYYEPLVYCIVPTASGYKPTVVSWNFSQDMLPFDSTEGVA